MDGCEHLIKYIFTAKFARENSQSTNAAIANDFRRVVHGDCKLTKSEKGEYIQKLQLLNILSAPQNFLDIITCVIRSEILCAYEWFQNQRSVRHEARV